MEEHPPRRVRRVRPALLTLITGAVAAAMVISGMLLLTSPMSIRAAGPGGGTAQTSLHLPFVTGGNRAPQPSPSVTPSQTAKPSETPEATATATATATTTATVTATPTATPSPTSPPLYTSHAGRFAAYEGSKTCNTCHAQESKEVHGSLHYQWQAPAPHVPGLTTGGKLGAINDFCGYPDINWLSILTNLDGQPTDGGCATCHAGMGARPAARTDHGATGEYRLPDMSL